MNYKDILGKDTRITILALSWRDIKSPTAGGAEVHTHEMLKRVDSAKFRIIHLAPLYEEELENEVIDGVQYLRKGNVLSVIGYAYLYYIRNRRNIDYVIDQCNTHRFFTPLWVSASKRIFYIHQLTREIWDINMCFPLSKIGKHLENMCLRLNKKDYTITVSKSTKSELVALGFSPEKIVIIPNGISFIPWAAEEWCDKEKIPTFVYVGRYAGYKGIDIAVESIGVLKEKGIKSKLWILGKRNEQYMIDKLLPICEKYGITLSNEESTADIISWGFVSEKKKLELLSRATALVFPSIREGWGIPVTEAGVVGTPSVVYDAPGIRDAVNDGEAGYLCESNNLEGLGKAMCLVLEDKDRYVYKRQKAYEFSCKFQWKNNNERIKKIFELNKN